jgi:hypothetical protein
MGKEKILATFKIDPDDWERFKQIANERGESASALLVEFVHWCLQGNQLPTTAAVENPHNLDKLIEEILDKRIASIIDSRIEAHREPLKAEQARIQELSAALSSTRNELNQLSFRVGNQERLKTELEILRTDLSNILKALNNLALLGKVPA